MSMTKTQAEAVLTAAGIPWDKINWANVWQIVQALIAMVIAGITPAPLPTPAPGPAPTPTPIPILFAKIRRGEQCSPDDLSCLQAHFDAITAISDCGSKCCSSHGPC